MDAVLTAGGTPEPGDPLYPYTQGKPKALLEIAGKPMIQWVLEALEGSTLIDRVLIIGIEADCGVTSPKVTAFIPDQGSLLENIVEGVHRVVAINPAADHVLYVSSDIPAITPEMVDWVVKTAKDSDLDAVYNLISRDVMEKRFPNSRRSFTRLRDVEVCGGDMNVIRARTVTGSNELWDRIIRARKNVLKQAALIGFDTLILLALRLITLDEGVKRATRRLKITGGVVLCPYAEVGMDVDKPNQLEMLREVMAQRGLSPSPA